jgi:hypothetical protein
MARLLTLARWSEDTAVGLALLAMGLLPVVELLLRGLFGGGLPGSLGYVQNLSWAPSSPHARGVT